VLISLALAVPAAASAPNTILVVKSALSGGDWDRFDIAGPSWHHNPWGGDWAVDFYGAPGDLVRFRIKELNPSTTSGDAFGVVESNASSCGSPFDEAGTAYQIGVYDGDGNHVGWVLYAHVETSGVGLLPVGSVVLHGDVLGTIEQFAFSSCFQVTTPEGVHTHVEMFNDSDYACYVPYAPDTTLFARDAMGGIGTSFSAGQACF
jgi:hypothetical protein